MVQLIEISNRALSAIPVPMLLSSESFGSRNGAVAVHASYRQSRPCITHSLLKRDLTRICLIVYNPIGDALEFLLPAESRVVVYANYIEYDRVLTSRVLASRDHWVLMQAENRDIFLVNVVTVECIDLPVVEPSRYSYAIGVVFSGTPSGEAPSDCRVYIVNQSLNAMHRWKLRPLQDPEWDFRAIKSEEENTEVMGLTLHNDRLWWVHKNGKLMSLDADDVTQSFESAPLQAQIRRCTASLLTHNGTLFLIRTEPLPIRCYKVGWGDGCSLEFVELTSLDGACFLVLEGKSGFALDNDNMANRVFIGMPINRTCDCISYSVLNSEVQVVKPCMSGMPGECFCTGAWFPPVSGDIPPQRPPDYVYYP